MQETIQGYTFKIADGSAVHFYVNEKDLFARLTKEGFINYKKPEMGPENWADDAQLGQHPHWGVNGTFGQVVKCTMTLSRPRGELTSVRCDDYIVRYDEQTNLAECATTIEDGDEVLFIDESLGERSKPQIRIVVNSERYFDNMQRKKLPPNWCTIEATTTQRNKNKYFKIFDKVKR